MLSCCFLPRGARLLKLPKKPRHGHREHNPEHDEAVGDGVRQDSPLAGVATPMLAFVSQRDVGVWLGHRHRLFAINYCVVELPAGNCVERGSVVACLGGWLRGWLADLLVGD